MTLCILRKKVLTVRVVRHRKRLPREVMTDPSLELCRAKLGVPAHGRGLGTGQYLRSLPT